MGCGASASVHAKSVAAIEVTTHSQAIQQPENKDRSVMILGRVASADEVFMPPFGVDDCVLIRVRVFRDGGNCGRYWKSDAEAMFSGVSGVDFKVRDKLGQEIRLDMSKPWKRTFDNDGNHTAYNIARDSSKGGLVSGGTEHGEHSKHELRPNAKAFWEVFNNGKDSYDALADMSGHAMECIRKFDWQPNRMRRAVESSIKIGDAVFVIGTLRSANEGMFLEGGDDSFITNNPRTVKQLSTVPKFDVPAGSATKVQMRRKDGDSKLS